MLQVTLGEKTYTIPFVPALALREIDRPLAILRRKPEDASEGAYRQDLDALVNWFCLLFGNQFTVDDVYALYPADRLLHDITLAMLAVQQNVSQALRAFPTKAAAEDENPAR